MKDLAYLRSDVVGSLLRPGRLKQARTGFDEGRNSREELRRIEDESIREAVALNQAGKKPPA